MSKAASVIEEGDGFKILEGTPPRKPGRCSIAGPSAEVIASLSPDQFITVEASVVKLSAIKSRCGVANNLLIKAGKPDRVTCWQEANTIVIRRRK